MSVYQSILGERCAALAAPVAKLHTTAHGARGVFRVQRGASLVARLLGFILGIPRASERAAIVLSVTRGDGVERWSRSFDGAPLWTDQWADGALLVEQLGPFQCVFRLVVDGQALVFEQTGARVGLRAFSLPLPRFLWPSISGRADERAGQVQVDVRIHAPLAGLLVSYDGSVTVD